MNNYAWFMLVYFAGEAVFAATKLNAMSKTDTKFEKQLAKFFEFLIYFGIAVWSASGLGLFD
jgi:hypothetical protein